VTVTNASTLPSGYATLIKNAIIAQFNGENNNTPAGIASLILALSYTGAIFAALPSVALVSVLVGLSGPATLNDVTMGIDQVPTLSAGNITVTAI
jgi:xanthine dehydrogenase molybdopterin-binding subunit B